MHIETAKGGSVSNMTAPLVPTRIAINAFNTREKWT